MSDNFGVTEWVDSTMPLKSFILSNESLIEDYKKSLSIHVKWIESSSGLNTSKRNMTESYLENIKSVGRDAAESHMKRMTDPSSGGLPGNLLVSAVMSRTSHCPEKFFRVRQHLIRSYATMCTVHWLLGIGDRHLENTLVSLESGSFVGIDFGRSFGTGNTLLPVPELVPFRLTKQMTALMMPYGPTGNDKIIIFLIILSRSKYVHVFSPFRTFQAIHATLPSCLACLIINIFRSHRHLRERIFYQLAGRSETKIWQ